MAQFDFLLSQVRSSTAALIGGKVYFYDAGTTTPRGIWLDAAYSTPAANPYTLDSNATAQLFGHGSYRIVVKDLAGVTVYDRDGISPDGAGDYLPDLWIDSRDYATLQLADAAAVAAGVPLVIAATAAVSGNTTLNARLQFAHGALITVGAGATLTIAGPFPATATPYVSGPGTVVYSKLQCPEYISSTEPPTTYAYQKWIDTSATPAVEKIRSAANDAWITLGTVSTVYTPAGGIDKVPAGAIMPYGGGSAPAGWLECDGSSQLVATYSALSTAIRAQFGGVDADHFNLPDLRGEFIRGWDHARGVDSGRAVASAQSDSFKAHNHSIWTSATTSNEQSAGLGSNMTSAVAGGRTDTGTTYVATTYDSHKIIQDTGSTETRPRNVALMYIIKY